MCKTLYSEASGSLSYLVASAGINPEAYFNVLDEEIEDGIYQKYLPHMTAYTNSSNNTNDQVGGRPTTDNPTENTIRSRNNNGNNIPSPSDSK